MTYKLGMAMDIMTLIRENDQHGLTLSIDLIHPNDFTERLYYGAEYSYRDMFFSEDINQIMMNKIFLLEAV